MTQHLSQEEKRARIEALAKAKQDELDARRMSPALKSPTCIDCAKARGYVAVSPAFTMSMGKCANCGEECGVSTSHDYKLPGERRHVEDWD